MKSLHSFRRSFSVAAALAAIPAFAAAADHPFMLQAPLNAQTPFTVTLPTKTEDGKTAKTVVIKFVSVNCEAAPGKQSIGTAQFTTAFNGQNGFFRLPFAPAMSFDNATEFAIAQPTLMFADAGSPLNFGLSGDSPTCTVVLTGNLIVPKDK